MARKKVRGLDEALDELFADYEKSLDKAMRYAGQEAKRDIRLEAEGCLGQYYLNYTPTWYDRTEQLGLSFVPYGAIKNTGKEIVVQTGMGYDPSRLDGLYYSNGSEQHQPVSGSMILENYLNGIHPRTNGYPIFAPVLEFDNVEDKESPNKHMDSYLEEYPDTFSNNVYKAFAKLITRR